MNKKVILVKLNIVGVVTTTYYGSDAIKKAEKYLKDNYNVNNQMEIYLEVTYKIIV